MAQEFQLTLAANGPAELCVAKYYAEQVSLTSGLTIGHRQKEHTFERTTVNSMVMALAAKLVSSIDPGVPTNVVVLSPR